MKKVLVAAGSLLLAVMAQAQQVIKIEEIGKHIGDSVTVCTKIYDGVFLERSKGSPTLLNAGAAYPGSPLTIVIWADAREKFTVAPEIFYKDKDICITGKITVYKDKPQIVLYNEKQVTVQ